MEAQTPRSEPTLTQHHKAQRLEFIQHHGQCHGGKSSFLRGIAEGAVARGLWHQTQGIPPRRDKLNQNPQGCIEECGVCVTDVANHKLQKDVHGRFPVLTKVHDDGLDRLVREAGNQRKKEWNKTIISKCVFDQSRGRFKEPLEKRNKFYPLKSSSMCTVRRESNVIRSVMLMASGSNRGMAATQVFRKSTFGFRSPLQTEQNSVTRCK